MAYEGDQIRHSFVAGEDLSSDQFKQVYLDANGMIYNDSNADARKLLGVLQDKPKVDQAGNVCLFGITKLAVGGATAAATTIAGQGAAAVAALVLVGTGGAGVATVLWRGNDVTA